MSPTRGRTAAPLLASLLAIVALAAPASAHEGFILTDDGIDAGAPSSEWRDPALCLAGTLSAPVVADTYLYERHAATWDEETERLLTMGGAMSCCREFEERDVEGNLLRFEVLDGAALPYKVEQIDTMPGGRVIGWGWGPDWPFGWRLFTFHRSNPSATLRTRDVLIEPGGMACLSRDRAVVLLRDGSGLVWSRGRGVEDLALPMRASWASFDGERLWMVGEGFAGFVPDVGGAPATWSCELAPLPAGFEPSRVVSTRDGHTAAYGFGGLAAFIGDELTTTVRVGLLDTVSAPHVAIGPGHRIWTNRASPDDGDRRGFVSIVDWFATEPEVRLALPGEVEGIVALPAAHEHE